MYRITRRGLACKQRFIFAGRRHQWLQSRSVSTSACRRQPATQESKDTSVTPKAAVSPPFKLRDYQEECVKSVLRALEEGKRRLGISLATGSGKTVIFTELIGRIEPPNAKATQTLILVHRRELVEQAAKHCSQRYPEKSVEIEMGDTHASGVADITVASIQSINSKDRIDKFDPARFKLVLVDEAHHIVASTYLRTLERFNLLRDDDAGYQPALVGVSATFARFDGLALGKAITHIVYHRDYIDMIGENHLSNVIFTTVESKANLSKVKKTPTGDFATGSLSKAVNNEETNLITVKAWQTKAEDRQSTLVFCVDLAHVESLTNTFRLHGVDARFITGDTPSEIRGQRLDAFRKREFPVLLNCGVFTEGTDIPNIDCVLLARPTKSRNLLVQMIGRGMRLHPEKENCHIIDMVASLEVGVVTVPTLFGLDPDELLVASTPEDMEGKKERKEIEKLREDNVTDVRGNTNLVHRNLSGELVFTDYDSVTDLIDDTSAERYIRAISPHAWVEIGNDRYILTNGPKSSYLIIETDEDSSFSVIFTQALPGQTHGSSKAVRHMKPRQIAEAATFEDAVHSADTFASKHFKYVFIATYPPGNWRRRPASESQVEFLNKQREEHNQLEVGDISMGKATDMITKLIYGAKGRIKEAQTAKRRQNKTEEKQRARKLRESVEVGPLPT